MELEACPASCSALTVGTSIGGGTGGAAWA